MSIHRDPLIQQSLPTEFNEPVHLGIIGGTGLYQLSSLTPVAKLTLHTPWGSPSSSITISKTSTGFNVAFLARHGVHHDYLPSEVPNLANIAAFKKIGVKAIIAFSAVGSLQQDIKPRDFVIPNQIIDRTKGIRRATFFEKGFVAHAGFGEPFDLKLNKIISKFGDSLEGDNVKLHSKFLDNKDLTVICMEGPQFSTRAESKLYQSWGGSVINMSVLPEAKLAREAEISYQMICMSTDYDAWRDDDEPVTVETVVGNLKANSSNANNIAIKIIEHLEKEIIDGNIGKDLKESMKVSVSTNPKGVKKELLEKMHYLFPGYWPLD
ncbi:Multicopy enhancer of UAS2 [Wickerhamomyces ciferrii]|uniref:S-methyl-5'-thioadenosine phosphorylase n=1 Tax=Wickerhamomyces ciferrii (strain ATCC 14091 / BCRC 22168 / CBS 111 / JCM 3599 / NBRC 0793 / NRRL Y-1031 F-60-10) TaxID=1206466 RepID=K0KJI4_WICCF|nr:Multicopy enhancer of UAS2 [Wickerhamomyces ciferrii]CCH43136.1 Multicopy enhancer of UAS2 [Wickerhamomyces ciferrii]